MEVRARAPLTLLLLLALAGCASDPDSDPVDSGVGGGARGDAASSSDAGDGSVVAARCTVDDDCRAAAPETSPPGCAVGRCNGGSGRCEYAAGDADGDGVASARCRSLGGVPVATGLDCDDDDLAIHPDAIELCNNRDDDCDGQIDEDIPPDPTITCVRPVGATAVNRCRTEGHAVCVLGDPMGGCTATPPAPQPDAPRCDDTSWDCNDTPNEGCDVCVTGRVQACATAELGCPGTQTCAQNAWGECQANAGPCECRNGETQACPLANGCPGRQTCDGNAWGACACPDPGWECTPGATRPHPNSPCPIDQTCDANGRWQGDERGPACHPTFGCHQSQPGDASPPLTVQESTCIFGCPGPLPGAAFREGPHFYGGALPPPGTGGTVGGTVRAEVISGGCFDNPSEQALRVECFASLPGCAQPPEGWANARVGEVEFRQNEVSTSAAPSTTKPLPTLQRDGRTLCCSTYRGTAEWSLECQGCCNRRFVFDWAADVPPGCY